MFGTQELIIIFAVILLLFGADKLPELARAIGKSMGEFKKAKTEAELKDLNEKEEEKKKDEKENEKKQKTCK